MLKLVNFKRKMEHRKFTATNILSRTFFNTAFRIQLWDSFEKLTKLTDFASFLPRAVLTIQIWWKRFDFTLRLFDDDPRLSIYKSAVDATPEFYKFPWRRMLSWISVMQFCSRWCAARYQVTDSVFCYPSMNRFKGNTTQITKAKSLNNLELAQNCNVFNLGNILR